MKIKRRFFSVVLSGFFLLSIQDLAIAGWGNNGYGYSGGHMMGSGFMGWFMILFWGMVLIALILLIRWIAQLPHGRETGQGTVKNPLDILKERLARGEIEIDEYREKKQLLS